MVGIGIGWTGGRTDNEQTLTNIMNLLICLQRHWNQLLWNPQCLPIH